MSIEINRNMMELMILIIYFDRVQVVRRKYVTRVERILWSVWVILVLWIWNFLFSTLGISNSPSPSFSKCARYVLDHCMEHPGDKTSVLSFCALFLLSGVILF